MLSQELVARMFADYQSGMKLAAVERKYGRGRKTVSNIFRRSGLKVRPLPYAVKRTETGSFAPAAEPTAREITSAINASHHFAVPAPLKTIWRHWSMEKRGQVIAQIRRKFKSSDTRPTTPFSVNVTPFDYTTPRAQAIIKKLNAGRPSHEAHCKICICSQGVIWRGQLWFWCGDNTGYSLGAWTERVGRPALHRAAWAYFHGRPVPPKTQVIMKDGNWNNLSRSNLALRTKNDCARQNQSAGLLKKSRAATQLLLKHSQQKETHEHDKIQFLHQRSGR